MKKPTTKDVADLAGVSQATVSMILNNKKNVSFADKTIEKVLQAARQLNYTVPSQLRTFQHSPRKLIALFTATMSNPYYPMWNQVIEETAIPRGYNILVCNIHRRAELEKYYMEFVTDNEIAGIVYTFTPSFPGELKRIAETRPVVVIGEKDDRLDIDTVGLNSYTSGMLVAEHLLALGHKQIAFITSPIENNMTLTRRQRYQGILSTLKEHGLENNLRIKSSVSEAELPNSVYEIQAGYNLTVELLEEALVTAIIGINDMTACGIMAALRDKGYKIPQHISVCGFDNIFVASIAHPKLTTIDHCITHRARAAIDILIEKIEHLHAAVPSAPLNNSGTYKIEYTPQLIIRDSTGPCPS